MGGALCPPYHAGLRGYDMMGCTNIATQWVPRGWGHVPHIGECGRTGVTGEPVYCVDCRQEAESRGHAKHQCYHGIDLWPEDGRDIPCGRCEAEAEEGDEYSEGER